MNYGKEVSTVEELTALMKDPSLIGGFKKNAKPFRPNQRKLARKLGPKARKLVKKLASVLPTMPSEMMKFIVYGKPCGYYSLGMKPNYTRMNRYHTYKKLVCKYAEENGIKLPLVCSKESHLRIDTIAYFENGVHADPENVRKGIIDSLFYSKEKKGCGDKFVGGFCESPIYDKDNPRVEIVITTNTRCNIK